MTFEQFLDLVTMHWALACISVLTAPMIPTAIVVTHWLKKIFYAKSEMEVNSGEVWMDARTIAGFAMILGILWPMTWYIYFTSDRQSAPFFPFVPHGGID